MKKLLDRRLIGLAVCLALFACASATPNQVAYRTVGVVVSTVDAAMTSYGRAVQAGQVPAPAQAKVKAAYTHYYDAALFTQAILKKGDMAPQRLQETAAALLAELAALGVK